MTDTKVIRYTTHPEHADENERLIRDVFAELAIEKPEGLHYTALRLDDGVSFVHVAVLDGDDNPLQASPAFARFQAGIGERCAEGPTPASATTVGSYGMLPD
jgi:acyl dehydratase